MSVDVFIMFFMIVISFFINKEGLDGMIYISLINRINNLEKNKKKKIYGISIKNKLFLYIYYILLDQKNKCLAIRSLLIKV